MLQRILPRTHRFRCADEHQLAAYVDQQLIGAERERVESHLAECDTCLHQVGFLIKQCQAPEGLVSSSLLQRAKRLAAPPQESALFGWKLLSAAAAVVLIVVGLILWRGTRPAVEEHSTIVATAQQPSVPLVPDKGSPPGDRAVRSLSPSTSLPALLSPQPGAIVPLSDFTIRWEPLPNAAVYDVRIVTADGDLVWRKRVYENSANPPKEILRAGVKYFVWVRAWLANGKSQQSAAVGFIGG